MAYYYPIGTEVLYEGLQVHPKGRGRIIEIDKEAEFPMQEPYLIEFNEPFNNGHEGRGFSSVVGKKGCCWWCKAQDIFPFGIDGNEGEGRREW
jgi:hypothetical protein